MVISDDLTGSGGLVVRALEEQGASVLALGSSQFAGPEVTFSVEIDGATWALLLADETSGLDVRLRPGDRALRRQPAPALVSPELDPGVAFFVDAQYRSALNALFSFDLGWMNPVRADRALDQNKTLGNLLAHEAGLRTIPTVVTDSPAHYEQAVRRFAKEGDVCLKAAAAWAAEIPGDPEALTSIYSVRLSEADALALADAAGQAPLHIQPYIEKQYELRVTVVNGHIFACRINSQNSDRASVDWRRYDFDRVTHDTYELPDEVAKALRRFMDGAGLYYAAIDIIRGLDGDYVFVEANPAGQFGWIEALTGQPISAAIADWLLKAER